jgi:hypothetical protein
MAEMAEPEFGIELRTEYTWRSGSNWGFQEQQ